MNDSDRTKKINVRRCLSASISKQRPPDAKPKIGNYLKQNFPLMLSSLEDAVTDSGSNQHLLLDEFESVLTNVECRVHQGIRRGKDRHDLKQVSIHQCQKSLY